MPVEQKQDPEIAAPTFIDGDRNMDTIRNDEEELKELPRYTPGDPFGDEENSEGVKYKVLNWWQCGMIMIAETVSLGILSLPSAVAAIGLVPAIILIIGLGVAATYTGLVIGQFKERYPHVHNMADAGEVLMGQFGRELLGAGQLLFLVFIMASHVLTFIVMMNTLTEHGTCSIVFGIVGMVVSLLCNIPRTLKNMSSMSVASFLSILVAVIATMIFVGIDHPGKIVQATVNTDFYHGFLAVTNIVFAFSGHVAFFSFISELKDPKDYPKSLYLLQITNTILYTVTAVVIYRYAGPGVTSPALGSAGPVGKKVAYGLAIPTIVIAGVINGHVACKYVYVRLFRGTSRMSERSLFSIGVWLLIVTILWVVAWIIAEAIPVFNNLLSLITALFASWFTYGLSGIFWLFINKGKWFSSPRKFVLFVINVLITMSGAAICGLGLYVSGKSLHDGAGGESFSCADNS